MKKFLVLLAFLSVFVSTFNAFAHDAKFHKEKPVEGTLASLDGDSLRLTTEKGNQQVTLTTETKIELEKAETKAFKKDLQNGQYLTVFGTKLETGELVAHEVVIHANGSKHSHDQ